MQVFGLDLEGPRQLELGSRMHPLPLARLERGVRLFRERGREITRTTGGTYHVPSCTGEASYHVYLGEVTTCSCPDSRRAKDAGEFCKHVHAAAIVAAKRRAARRRRAS